MPTQPNGAVRTVLTGSFADALFSPDGTRLYAVAGNTISVVDVVSGSTLTTYTLGTSLGGADISPNGSALLVADERASGGGLSLFYRNRPRHGQRHQFRRGRHDGGVRCRVPDRYHRYRVAAGNR